MIIFAQKDTTVEYYQFSTTSLTKHRFFNGIDTALIASKKLQSRACFLLKEKNFFYYTFTITLTSREKFTINDYKAIVQEKLSYISRKDGIETTYCNYECYNCTVNNQKTEQIIGKQWTLCFDLSFVIPKNDIITTIKKVCGSKFLMSDMLTLLPLSYYIIKYIDTVLQKKDAAIITIDENSVDLHIVHQWFYSRIESVNMWESLLRACYKDNNIDQYLYEWYETVEKNHILKKLIMESLEFYTYQISSWMKQYLSQWSDLFLVTNLIDNPYFLDVLTQQYNKVINWFIVPLWTLFHTDKYKEKPLHSEIAIFATELFRSEKSKPESIELKTNNITLHS